MSTNTENHNWSKSREWQTVGLSALDGSSVSDTLLSRLRDHLRWGRESVRTGGSAYLQETNTFWIQWDSYTYGLIVIVTAHTHKNCTRSSQTTSRTQGRDTAQNPTTSWRAIDNWGQLGEGESVLCKSVASVRLSTCHWIATARRTWAAQIRFYVLKKEDIKLGR